MFELTPERALIIEKTAVIADLHLGIENAMQNVGIAIPRMQITDIIERTSNLIKKYDLRRLIVAGDLKHEFSTNLPYEWEDVKRFVESVEIELSVVRGNHDNYLAAILAEYSIELKEYEKVGDYYVIHGHRDFDFEKIIMGHEHPAVKVRVRGAMYSFPCFLVADKSKIVLPAFSKLVAGSDVLQKNFLSPILAKAKSFEVYAVEDEVFYLGELETLRNLV
ncbi:MAG: uncharacterized protein PWQ58_1082 [Archaeoglobaceae archaeon]|nr:uncharacterized protein [Archaeoglobaceae archaeon]